MRAYAEPDALPAKVRRMLRVQCDGEWERVVIDHDGSFLVMNNAQQARRFLGLDQPSAPRKAATKPPAKKAPAAPAPRRQVLEPPPEPPRRTEKERIESLRFEPGPDPGLPGFDEPVYPAEPPQAHPPKRPVAKSTPPPKQPPAAEVRALGHLLREGQQTYVDSKGVTVVAAPESVRLQRAELQRMVWSGAEGEPDWDSIDLDSTAFQLQQRLQHGLPSWLQFMYHPDVLALEGMDLDLMGDALRFPERVEVRPETRAKKYPVLRFVRGDIDVILGLRNPHKPAIIAAYAGARLLRGVGTPGGGGTGGGGARKQRGLPSTTKASLKWLRNMGCEIDIDTELDAPATVEVQYKGQSLGKINLAERTTKQMVQSDYQRTIRRMEAIDRRAGAPV